MADPFLSRRSDGLLTECGAGSRSVKRQKRGSALVGEIKASARRGMGDVVMRAVLVAGLWLGLGLAGVAVGPTFAEGRCDAPMSEWKSRDALERAVMGLGWTMQRLRSDHGCYMVAARDQNGTAILAEFLPETLELLSVEVDRDASACAAPVAAREGKSGGNRDDHADADRGQDD